MLFREMIGIYGENNVTYTIISFFWPKSKLFPLNKMVHLQQALGYYFSPRLYQNCSVSDGMAAKLARCRNMTLGVF
jgi:hypothetical protein